MKKIILIIAILLSLTAFVWGFSLDMGTDLDIDATPESGGGAGGPTGDGFVSSPGNYFISSEGNYFTSN